MFKKLMAEALGTGILVVSVCATAIASGRLTQADSDLLATSVSAGLTLSVIYLLFAPLSGGHFNPALTVASLITKHVSTSQAIKYVIAQVIGAAVGALAIFLILSLQPGFQPLGFAANGYGPYSPGGYPMLAVFAIELLFAAILAMVFLQQSLPKTVIAIVLGATYTAAHLATGAISGTSLNPARSTGAALFAEGWAIDQLWLFWLAPMLGAATGALFSRYFAAENTG